MKENREINEGQRRKEWKIIGKEMKEIIEKNER